MVIGGGVGAGAFDPARHTAGGGAGTAGAGGAGGARGAGAEGVGAVWREGPAGAAGAAGGCLSRSSVRMGARVSGRGGDLRGVGRGELGREVQDAVPCQGGGAFPGCSRRCPRCGCAGEACREVAGGKDDDRFIGAEDLLENERVAVALGEHGEMAAFEFLFEGDSAGERAGEVGAVGGEIIQRGVGEEGFAGFLEAGGEGFAAGGGVGEEHAAVVEKVEQFLAFGVGEREGGGAGDVGDGGFGGIKLRDGGGNGVDGGGVFLAGVGDEVFPGERFGIGISGCRSSACDVDGARWRWAAVGRAGAA